ncbi:polyprenyl synthetase family protein [Desulfolucanica intricata]|uniref:polyprenyl synthetase family protein n=1 Tax=Desulfolucanica intricata TaxID=1285191 RepID=UPI00082B9E77|nr:farnesyl diphosphate synthase [Desulfolucanica intricata]
MEFLQELNKKAAIVDDALDKFLPPDNAYPSIIHQAIRYSVFAGGKRLRPAMVMAAAEAVNGDGLKVLPAACALELIHTYSLVHDDLPAMDNDDFRRGKLTNHKVYGEAIAVLTGDALLTFAFQLLAGLSKDGLFPPEVVVRVIAEVAKDAGTNGLIGGQVVDTISANQEIDSKTLEYIHNHKTGSLYRASIRTGAILAGAPEAELSALTFYAEHLGLAFQITDDILDVVGDTVKIGKPVGSDQKNNKATYPSIWGLEEAREKAFYFAEQALNQISIFGSKAQFLRELVHFIINRDH